MIGPAIIARHLCDLSGGYASTYVVVVTALLVATMPAIGLAVGHHRPGATRTPPARSPVFTRESKEAG
jgi:hypothetical protein